MGRVILITFIFVAACNSKPEANTDTVALKEDTVIELRYVAKTPLGIAGCYSWTAGRDTATLHLQVTEKQVTGDLVYDWSEKDGNTGTLQGVVQDSLLVANYTFQSEGMTSVREAVFKIKGDSLLEGFGDLTTSGDTIKFKNKGKLQFQNDRPFVKGGCKE
ncbi:MAG: hypothetical protein AVDCRST_MAG96-1882 [uncultured Segetibacter sp.]|uniref:Uncharacterized protein n=1 Tax=uncultured Segetibacter sp. TaxID=481133 RepID=A0A6J4SH83_9BACT|nr:MAG: hypothetical protein AVDCRST_MAG96-1882 [uncultured Segetibacter sp.]